MLLFDTGGRLYVITALLSSLEETLSTVLGVMSCTPPVADAPSEKVMHKSIAARVKMATLPPFFVIPFSFIVLSPFC